MKILLLSCHLYQSKNKAGFHHLADAFSKLNHSVYFCTCPNSILNLAQDLRITSSRFYARLKSILYSFFPKSYQGITIGGYASIVHNFANSNHFQSVITSIFLSGYSRLFAKKHCYDIVIFESGVCLYLFHILKKRFPKAVFIYRISDILFLIGASDHLIHYQKNLLDSFDLLVVPNQTMAQLFKEKVPSAKILMQLHGVNTNQYDVASRSPSPFDTHHNHAVYIGMSDFDWTFIERASALFPNIQFHIIGPYEKKLTAPNVIYYGLLAFDMSLPYLAHCDIGLNIGHYLRESDASFIKANKPLKYIQYTYFKKPIIAPARLMLNEPHVISYELNDKSIANAISEALNGQIVVQEKIHDWSKLCQDILSHC